MSVSEVVSTYGPWRVAALTLALAAFLALALARWPFALVARLLVAAQRGLDERITTAVAAAGPRGSDRRSPRV